jgi:hypothetical protein
MDMFGLTDPAAALGKNQGDLFKLRLDAAVFVKFHEMAFDDVAILADDLNQLPRHVIFLVAPRNEFI